MADSNNEPPVFRAKKVEDGGPAFGYGNHEQGGHSGMSLRDYFAAKALQGLMSAHDSSGIWAAAEATERAAQVSYWAADAMIAARKAGA